MSDSPTPSERLYAIVEQALCIGCGLCQSVAGPDKVRMLKVENGNERPVVVGDLDHETVDVIYDVCPGTRVEGLPARLIDAETRLDNVWGPWRRMVHAWASDPEIRFEGSTGGVLTALADYLLASGRVDFVLHAKASSSDPSFGERHLSFDRADVLEGAGSRYGPTATLIDIRELLDRGQAFAFVGKPCDIAALRNYARHDARVDRLVRYWLTPVCGGFMPPDSNADVLRRFGIDPTAVTALRYRGRGCPGPTRIETADEIHELHYLDFWGEDASQWSLPFRCKICPDGIGEAADIAAADAWPGGAPDREESLVDPGVNAVVVRTAVGQELLEAAVRDGAVTLDSEVTPDEMNGYQPHQRDKKYAVWARHQGLGDEGRIVPRTERLRIADLAAELPEPFSEDQRAGTRRRVRDGKASEPTPRPSKG